MEFAPKRGCPMCGIVSAAAAAATSPHSPSNPNTHEILWRDDNFTVYRETANPVSSKGHIVIVFNLHVPSIYTLSSSDLPLLVTLRDLSYRLLASLQTPSSPLSSPISSHPQGLLASRPDLRQTFRVGFITPPFKDNKIPVTDHLHAHAYILPADRMGWWRAVAYSSIAWYDVNDLIAEIREETTNNKVRSSTNNPRPIDFVPDAGARRGTADGVETTDPSLLVADPERGEANLLPPTPGSSRSGQHPGPSPDATIPHLRV
ncbi:hypothetical protein BN946_scf184942.g69 [Trametes cinnabarina]|uniref:HIT domain-containing protein n=1 Tax=Pycnoporus cinnabarinus TaxID=5643 RepID=A0A060SDB8_PYCCI|nr:hypothetical protein BN946_scf184942.g69 [Trametes cinnabarina]